MRRTREAATVLYISYDGICDPLGESQIAPYLIGLADKGVRLIILSFEKGQRARLITKYQDKFRRAGIKWYHLRYHKSPRSIATFFDILAGLAVSQYIILRHRPEILHCRTFIGAALGIWLKKICGLKLFVDVRGFWPAERIEARLFCRESMAYRIMLRVEDSFYRYADAMNFLTNRAKAEMEKARSFQRIYTTVIPTCAAESRFAAAHPAGQLPRYDFVYAGSVSTWYMLEEMLEFYKTALEYCSDKPAFLFLTQEKAFLEEKIKKKGLSTDDFCIKDAGYEEIPEYLARGRAGLAFYQPGYSRLACCPVKAGEYLMAGMPFIITKGIGDTDSLLARERVGYALEEFSVSEYRKALACISDLLKEKDIRQRCRAAAEKYFSLKTGIEKYYQVYQKLTIAN